MLLSEYPPGTLPRPWHFPERNRIISGLCRSVVVVEAPEGSGALYTADFALEQGRDLYVHAAGSPGSTGAGTRRLAEDGAPVIRSAAGLLADWGWRPVRRPARARGAEGRAARRRQGSPPCARAVPAHDGRSGRGDRTPRARGDRRI